MRWDFHGLTIVGRTDDDLIRKRWQSAFASRPSSQKPASVTFSLALARAVPSPPSEGPSYSQGDLLHYFVAGSLVTAHFPRFGQIRLDLRAGTSDGRLIRPALEAPGAFEDLIAIGLSPHLRRRGLFLLHAFATALDGQGILLVGDIGSGKTTTGLALLHAGYKLLSNDSPLIGGPGSETGHPRPRPVLLSYPGLISAYPDLLAMFPELTSLLAAKSDAPGKVSLAAESVWPEVWIDQAEAAAIFFPRIEPRVGHSVVRLTAPETLRLLLPHAIEQWDRAMMPSHLALLATLAETVPAFILRLGPDLLTIPETIASAVSL